MNKIKLTPGEKVNNVAVEIFKRYKGSYSQADVKAIVIQARTEALHEVLELKEMRLKSVEPTDRELDYAAATQNQLRTQLRQKIESLNNEN